MGKLTEEDKKFISLLKPEWKWVARDWNNDLYLYKTKPTKSGEVWITNPADEFYRLMFGSYFKDVYSLDWDNLFCNINWEDEEPTRLREPILDNIEKNWFRNILRNPCFRNIEVTKIYKYSMGTMKACIGISYIDSKYDKNYENDLYFPIFNPKKMYVGMKFNHVYTLEELELTEE